MNGLHVHQRENIITVPHMALAPENILLFVKGGQLRARRIETPGYPIHNCASMNGCSLLQSSYESLHQ